MPGIKSLRRIELGKETTGGTQVKATTLWRGTGTLKNDQEVVNPIEDIGIVMTTDRVYIPKTGGTLTLEAAPATFEQLPYLFEMGVKAVASGVADSTGSGYVYTYGLPTTAKNSINTYSIEAGDDNQAEFSQYCFAESIKLSGKVNAAIEMSAVLKTRAVAPVAYTAATISFSTTTISDSANGFGIFNSTGWNVKVTGSTIAANNTVWAISTGSTATLVSTGTMSTSIAGSTITVEQFFSTVSIPAVEEILFNKGTLAIDPSTGTAGATVVSQTFLKFDLDLKTGWKGQPAGDGRLDFSFTKSTRPSGTLKVTFEHDGSASTEKAAWLAKTARQVRIKVQGSALATAGVYTYKTLILDVVGRWIDFSALEDDNGNDTVTGTLLFGYDSTAATSGSFVVVNSLSALP